MIEIVIDTREQTPFHFDEHLAKVSRGTLKTGDYACKDDHAFAVERKSLGDFLSTISTGWPRFVREMDRARAAGFPAFPIVVEARFSEIIYSLAADGQVQEPATEGHERLSPQFVLKRIGDLAQLGGVVVFADGPVEATVLTFQYLLSRWNFLHSEDAE